MGKASFQKYAEDVEEHMKSLYKDLSEKDKRRYAAAEAGKLGYGGQQYICQLLGCSPTTLRVGRKELHQGLSHLEKGIRRPGGGRKKIRALVPGIDETFLRIIGEQVVEISMDENVKWINLGIRDISRALQERGYTVSEHVVKQLCIEYGYAKRKGQKIPTIETMDQQIEGEMTPGTGHALSTCTCIYITQ